MVECVRLIIGEGRKREREREKRSVDRLIQSNLGGSEGTAMLGTKRGQVAVDCRHHPHQEK